MPASTFYEKQYMIKKNTIQFMEAEKDLEVSIFFVSSRNKCNF